MASIPSPSQRADDETHSEYDVIDSAQIQASWRTNWAELYEYRYLLRNLVLRDLKVRYKGSALGIVWSLLSPLLMMAVFTILFGVFANGNTPNFHIFVLVGILPWNMFNEGAMGGTGSIVNNASLVKKVFFPREILPIAVVIGTLINFLIASLVLIVMLFVAGLGLTVHALWVFPIMVAHLLFTLGFALFLSAAFVSYRDVGMVMGAIMTAWFFATPVFYPLERFTTFLWRGFEVNPAALIRWLNPMASIVDGYRTVLWGVVDVNGSIGRATSMDPLYFLRVFVTCLIVFIFGYWYFKRKDALFGEKL